MVKAPSADIALMRDMKVHWRTDGKYSSSRASDISVAGAFINTPHPLPEGTVLGLRLEAEGREIGTQAVVRRTIPGQGMGVAFQTLSPDDRARLAVMVRLAEQQTAAQAKAEEESRRNSKLPALPRSRMQSSPERRTRARYRFSAMAEIAEAESGQSISGQLSNLGHSGCYVKLDAQLPVGTAVEIRITHNEESFRARAAVKSAHPGKGLSLTFADVAPEARKVLDDWLAVSMERAWLSTNRRSSQRVMVTIPVRVESKTSLGTDLFEETKTISVSANGALLAVEMELTKGQTITLRDPVSQNALECSVDYVGTAQQGRREIGVSFVLPNRSLWRIAFPPANWSTQDPYAKGS